MEKIDFEKLNKEQMIIAFNFLKDDYKQLFIINNELNQGKEQLIYYLKDKIKKYEEKIEKTKYKGSGIVEIYQEKINSLKDVLNIVSKGEK